MNKLLEVGDEEFPLYITKKNILRISKRKNNVVYVSELANEVLKPLRGEKNDMYGNNL